MSRYAQLAEKREAERKRHQRRKLLKALRNGDYDRSTTTHTVQLNGQPLVISEVEYLWLYVRDHMIGSTVGDAHFIHYHPTTTFNHKDYRP